MKISITGNRLPSQPGKSKIEQVIDQPPKMHWLRRGMSERMPQEVQKHEHEAGAYNVCCLEICPKDEVQMGQCARKGASTHLCWKCVQTQHDGILSLGQTKSFVKLLILLQASNQHSSLWAGWESTYTKHRTRDRMDLQSVSVILTDCLLTLLQSWRTASSEKYRGPTMCKKRLKAAWKPSTGERTSSMLRDNDTAQAMLPPHAARKDPLVSRQIHCSSPGLH